MLGWLGDGDCYLMKGRQVGWLRPCTCVHVCQGVELLRVSKELFKIGTSRNGIIVQTTDNGNYCGVPVSD